MSQFTAVLNHLKTRLRDQGVPFAIGGAFALAAHGHPRFTDDLDLMVLSQTLEPVHRALQGDRYEYINEVTFRDTPSGLYIDIIPVEDEAQRDVFDRAERTDLHDAGDLRVITPEGAVVMLLREATIGDQDRRPLRLRDVELLSQDGDLSWSYIRKWVEKMGYEQAYADLQVPSKPSL